MLTQIVFICISIIHQSVSNSSKHKLLKYTMKSIYLLNLAIAIYKLAEPANYYHKNSMISFVVSVHIRFVWFQAARNVQSAPIYLWPGKFCCLFMHRRRNGIVCALFSRRQYFHWQHRPSLVPHYSMFSYDLLCAPPKSTKKNVLFINNKIVK